jgi:hypothetical protein
MVGFLAAALIAGFGSNAARKYTHDEPSVWLDPHASEDLLSSRLNVTSVAKTPRPQSVRTASRR